LKGGMGTFVFFRHNFGAEHGAGHAGLSLKGGRGAKARRPVDRGGAAQLGADDAGGQSPGIPSGGTALGGRPPQKNQETMGQSTKGGGPNAQKRSQVFFLMRHGRGCARSGGFFKGGRRALVSHGGAKARFSGESRFESATALANPTQLLPRRRVAHGNHIGSVVGRPRRGRKKSGKPPKNTPVPPTAIAQPEIRKAFIGAGRFGPYFGPGVIWSAGGPQWRVGEKFFFQVGWEKKAQMGGAFGGRWGRDGGFCLRLLTLGSRGASCWGLSWPAMGRLFRWDVEGRRRGQRIEGGHRVEPGSFSRARNPGGGNPPGGRKKGARFQGGPRVGRRGRGEQSTTHVGRDLLVLGPSPLQGGGGGGGTRRGASVFCGFGRCAARRAFREKTHYVPGGPGGSWGPQVLEQGRAFGACKGGIPAGGGTAGRVGIPPLRG